MDKSFDSAPTYFLMMVAADDGKVFGIAPVGEGGTYMTKDSLYSGSFVSDMNTAWSNNNKTVTWNNDVAPRYQFNEADKKYIYYTF